MPSQPNSLPLADLARTILDHPPAASMPVRVVAIDGHGGAGKSTLADRVALAVGATIVHTDDFASWEVPLDWWPRLVEQILEPLAAGRAARYQRYDWVHHALQEWIDIPPGADIVLEGVTSSRREFRPYLSYAIWVDTPRDTCLTRGLERDGTDMLPAWEQWGAAEDHYIERDHPAEYADIVIAGAPTIEHDPERDVVVCSR